MNCMFKDGISFQDGRWALTFGVASHRARKSQADFHASLRP